MTRDETREALKRYVNEEILGDGQDCIDTYEDDILMTGLVDSIGVMRLVAFIQDSFEVDVPPEDVTIESFRSVAAISDYLERRTEG